MSNVTKVEIKKAFHTKGFWIALLAGALVVVFQTAWFVRNVYLVNQDMREYVLTLTPMDEGYGTWFDNVILEGWIGCEPFSPYNQMLFAIFPLLAVLPFGISLYTEWNSGYAGQILARCGRKKYLRGKFTAAFLSGGVVATFPLALSLLASACYLPVAGVDVLAMRGIVANYNMWATLYYEKPLLYAACYILLDFLYGGLFSLLAVLVSVWLENRFSILLFPLLAYLTLYYGLRTVFNKFAPYNPACYINPAQVVRTRSTVVFGVTCLLFALIGTSLWMTNRKRELL